MTRRNGWLLAGWAALIVCALLTVPRASYQPGKLLAAHSEFDPKCAGCHRPWHPVDNSGCISCHGDFAGNNPHGGYYVFDDKDGLIAGRHLATFKDNLGCLSCHSEHRGRDADFRAQAAFACTWCHHHPGIAAVARHRAATLARHESANQMFAQSFNHYQHRLLMSLQAGNFPKGFDCATCHLVVPAKPGAADQMTIAWPPCAHCHASPQAPSLALPASLGAAPASLPYSGVVRTLHVNAVFNHSTGHLQTPCVQCHPKVADSAKPGDANSLQVAQCFTCHAHQENAAGIAIRPEAAQKNIPGIGDIEGVALARQTPPVVACGQCHWFHAHGPVPIQDFSKPPLKQPPGMRRAGVFAPWGIGAIAIVLLGVCGIGYTILLPAAEEHHGPAMESAPQRILKSPVLDDTYQTSLAGLYIIGEMSGTASINLAMRSGRQVIDAIAENFKHSKGPALPDVYDVLIVGCGPAGLGATATAKAHGLSYVTLERMTPASTLRTFPRAKFVQATPIDILEYGSFFLEGDSTREDLIAEWDKIISQAGLVIQDREEVVGIAAREGYFIVRTAKEHEFKARCVVLAIGLRGHPRRLNVSGEAAGRVHYQLIEPDDFRNQRILVVGGGNAGAEVTQALAAPHLGNTVTYSIRDQVLSKVTHENGEKVIALQRSGAITLHPGTELKEIREKTVVLQPVKGPSTADVRAAPGPIELENDLVFAMLGAELPTRFLQSLGIRMEVKHR